MTIGYFTRRPPARRRSHPRHAGTGRKRAEQNGTKRKVSERNGTKRNETESFGKFRKVSERIGTFRDGPRIRKSMRVNAFPILSRESGFAGTGYAGQASRTEEAPGTGQQEVRSEPPEIGRNRTERNGKFRKVPEPNGTKRKVPERNGTFRDGCEIHKSFGVRGLPVLSREQRKLRERRGEMGSEGTLKPGLERGPQSQCSGIGEPRASEGRAAKGRGSPHSALSTQHSALRTGVFGCQALRRRTPKARPLHPYRARKPLRAQTCRHRGVPCRNSRPGRRPKFSFSRDFAPRGGCRLRAQICHLWWDRRPACRPG